VVLGVAARRFCVWSARFRAALIVAGAEALLGGDRSAVVVGRWRLGAF
jgi:hypothetical protein